MPEDLLSDDGWALPTERDELLRRVVNEGQRKLRASRLLVAGATIVVLAGLSTGLVLLEDDPGIDDRAGLELPVTNESSPVGETSRGTPSTVGSTPITGTTVDPAPSNPVDPAPPAGTPSGSNVIPSEPATPPDAVPTSTAPEPSPLPTPGTFEPVRPDPTTPPPTTTPTTPVAPPVATVGPISRSADAIVPEPVRGTASCTGPTTSTITAPVDNATSATLSWRVGKESGNKPMAIEGGAASATLGPFDKQAVETVPGPATVDVTVIVVGDGNLASSQGAVTLIDCPPR